MESTHNKRYARRKVLIKPRLQLTIIGCFLGVSLLGFFLQATQTALLVEELGTDLGMRTSEVNAMAIDIAMKSLGISLMQFLPIVLAIGTLITFRFAGPVYRFEQWLGSFAKGEPMNECRIRKGDFLTGLCDKLNQAFHATRSGADADTNATDESVELREVA